MFAALAEKGQGFTLAAPAIPVSQQYAGTVAVDASTTTTAGQWGVEGDAPATYAMAVAGDAAAGTFVLDVSIDADFLYAETAEETTATGSASVALSVPGTYKLTFHAEGTYTVQPGGAVVLAGTFGYEELGGYSASSDVLVSAGAASGGVAGWSAKQTGRPQSVGQVGGGSFGGGVVSSSDYIIVYSNHEEVHENNQQSAHGRPLQRGAPSNVTGTTGTTLGTTRDTVDDFLYVEWGTHTAAGDVGNFYYHASFSDSASFSDTDGWSASDTSATTTESDNGSVTIGLGASVWSSVTVSGWFDPSGGGGTFSTNDGAEYHEGFTGWDSGTSDVQDSDGSVHVTSDWSGSGSASVMVDASTWGSFSVVKAADGTVTGTASGGYLGNPGTQY